ncbi:hypothetical protein PIROE2DRAFT_65504, partial [Piromyces sp. E2]
VTTSAYYISQLEYTIPETQCSQYTNSKEYLRCLDKKHEYSDVIVSIPADDKKYFLYYESGWFNKGHRVTFKNCEFTYDFFNTRYDNNKIPPRIDCYKSDDSKYPEISINLDLTTEKRDFSLDHFVVSKVSNLKLFENNNKNEIKQICDAKKESLGATVKNFYFDIEGFRYKEEGDKYGKVDKLISYKGIYGRFVFRDITGCKKK